VFWHQVLTKWQHDNMQLSVCCCSVAATGFQYMTETYIAVQRIDKFLSMPEPPPPTHLYNRYAAAATGRPGSTGRVAVAGLVQGGAAVPSHRQQQQQRKLVQQPQQQADDIPVADRVDGGGVDAAAAAAVANRGVTLSDLPDGYVELGGADYDWNTNVDEMAAQDVSGKVESSQFKAAGAGASVPGPPSLTAAAVAATGVSNTTSRGSSSFDGLGLSSQVPRRTLTGVKLVVHPGELLAGWLGTCGVCLSLHTCPPACWQWC
jgi:hypothetical protein